MTRSWDDEAVETFLVGLADDPGLAERVAGRVRDLMPDYRPMSEAEHVGMLRAEFRTMLVGLSRRAEPTQADIDQAVATGAVRARQGVALRVMIEAFHLSLRLLWEEVLRTAQHDPALRAKLAERMLVVWEWVDTVTSVAASAHQEATQERSDTDAARLLTVLDGVDTGPPDARTTMEARRLGFDPDDRFVVACTQLEGFARVRRTGRHLPAAVLRTTPRGTLGVVVVQNVAPDRLVEAFRTWAPGTPAGVSSARRGLAALPLGQVEAQRVLSLGIARRGVFAYDDHWLLSILFENRRHLPESTDHVIRVAQENPHLAEAVTTFADHGPSVSTVARRLHLHANTLRYRLERWHTLTGWDPHTFSGLARSVTAIELAR